MLEPLVYHFRPLAGKGTLFLDRDGVLNEVVLRGDEISSPRLLPELVIADDLSFMNDPSIAANWNLVVVSNQPDLARRTIDTAFVETVLAKINQIIPLNAAYICPHQSSDGCACRKPGPGLIERFRADHPQSAEHQWLIGDREADSDCAAAAGTAFILRRRPYNEALAARSKWAIDDLAGLVGILKATT